MTQREMKFYDMAVDDFIQELENHAVVSRPVGWLVEHKLIAIEDVYYIANILKTERKYSHNENN